MEINMVKGSWLALTFLMSTLSLYAMTANASDEPCKEIEISAEVGACVALQYKKADDLLNVTYKRTLRRVDAAYKAEPALGAEMKKNNETGATNLVSLQRRQLQGLCP